MIPPAELQAKIALWRQKALMNELSLDELKEAVAAMRADRVSAVTAVASRKKKVRAAVPSADELLKELGIE